MRSLMLRELLPRTETRGTNINPVTYLACRVRAFHAYRVCEVAIATVALDLQTRLIYSYIRSFT